MTLQLNSPNPEELAYEELLTCKESEVPAAQEALYGKLFSHAKAVVFLMLHTANDTLARDIVTKIFLSLESFQQRSKFTTWVHAIAINECLMHLRAQRVHKEKSLNDLNPLEYIKLVTDASLDEEIMVNKLFNQPYLSNDDKLLLKLRLKGNFSWKDIARTMNSTKNKVKSRYRELKKKFKSLGEQNGSI